MKLSRLAVVCVFSGILAFPSLASVVFQDTFETDLAVNSDTDVNYQYNLGRQSGTDAPVQYYEAAGTGAGAFLNVPTAGFNGSDVLLLRNNYISTQVRHSSVALTNDFSSLVGKKYNISYDGVITLATGAGNDLWTSISLLGDISNLNELGPNQSSADFGLLIRQDGRVDVWGDATLIQGFGTGTSGVSVGSMYSLDILVDETGAGDPTAKVIFNQGTVDEVVLGTFSFDWEGSEQRNLGFKSVYGTAGSGTQGSLFDSRIDNLRIEIISEAVTGYEEWAVEYGLSDTNGGTMSEDFDGDGVSNLAEFALGGNPTNSASRGNLPVSALVADDGTNWFEYIHYERNDKDVAGLSYNPEHAEDLVFGTWTNTGFSFVGSGAFGDEFDIVTNRIPTTDAGARFVRLLIQLHE